MKFLAVALALVISAEGIKVKTTDESFSKEKWGFSPYYQWVTCGNSVYSWRCCKGVWGAARDSVSNSYCS